MPRFDNRFVRELPGDADDSPNPRQVLGALWSNVSPTPVLAPRLLAYSREVAQLLELSDADISSPDWLAALAGNQIRQ